MFFKTSQSRSEKAKIGHQLFERVLQSNQKLFISEDISQLKSAFENELQCASQQETVDNKSSFMLNDTIFLITILATLVSLSFYSYLISATLFTCIIAIFISIICYKRYSQKFFNNSFDEISNQLQKEKELYKKLMQLIEDNIIFTEKQNQEKRIEILKVAFRDIGLKSFHHFRKCTNLLLKHFPLTTELDENLICYLPNDSFDSYNNDEELTLKALKSLKQLIRIQISELLKRFLFLFVRNYFINPEIFDSNFYPYLQTNILDHLLTESLNRQKELLSVLYYHKSFYEQDISFEQVNLKKDSCTSLWPACRNIRKNLYSSLSIVDQFESMCEATGELTSESKANFETKLDLLNHEITNMQETVQSIFKTLKLQDIQAKKQNVEIDNQQTHQAEIKSEQSTVCVEEYVAQDEVFEAYIPQKYENNSSNSLVDIENVNSALETEASDNVFRELKHALKNKAIEHKVREAKVLGIEVDVKKLEEEYVATVIEKDDKEERKRIFVGPTKEETPSIGQSEMPTNYNFAFNFDIAMKATEKMRLLLDVNEDTFECDTDDIINEGNSS